jgi:tight adherence protein C
MLTSPVTAGFAGSASERRQLEKQLPQVLDLLVVCVEAGHSLDSSLQQIVQVFSGPLIDELKVVLRRAGEGTPLERALLEMGARCGVAELDSAITAIAASRQMGTPLAPSLRSHASQLRQRRAQKAEEEARKATVKILFPLTFCIFPVMLVILLGPALIGLSAAFGKLP